MDREGGGGSGDGYGQDAPTRSIGTPAVPCLRWRCRVRVDFVSIHTVGHVPLPEVSEAQLDRLSLRPLVAIGVDGREAMNSVRWDG
jgi:hypothetical protein